MEGSKFENRGLRDLRICESPQLNREVLARSSFQHLVFALLNVLSGIVSLESFQETKHRGLNVIPFPQYV